MSEGSVDLLVLGGGMAGLAAAARTVQVGGTAVLVERAAAVGGSATYAEFVWTAPDLETFRERNPGGDPGLAAAFIADFEPAVQWMRDLGVEVRDPVSLLNFGIGYQSDLANLFLIERRMIEGGDGSEVLLGAEPERLLIAADGTVEGAEVTLASGERREIRAAATLLATGGYGGDPELRRRHLGPNAENMPLRANPHSRGTGLRLAEAAGAQFGLENAAFYGHLWATGVPVKDPFMFAPSTFYHSEHGLLLNLAGERFLDETVGDQLNAIAAADQPGARCLLIYDEYVHREWMMRPYVEGIEPVDKFEAAYKAGARCAIAEGVEEFRELPAEWGYDAEGVHRALVEYNRAAAGGETLDPPRTVDARPLDEPPYYVIDVEPAITFTFGGARIDTEARILDQAGEPIPGLLAAGADAGGLYHRAYAGGLSPALVFGLRAAETARRRARATA
ncbi:MAG TPA: FAD-binding protein [Solirubrobacterales bacterium]|nr:FAD-binding protein [Solirubrobacterales bacterium]